MIFLDYFNVYLLIFLKKNLTIFFLPRMHEYIVFILCHTFGIQWYYHYCLPKIMSPLRGLYCNKQDYFNISSKTFSLSYFTTTLSILNYPFSIHKVLNISFNFFTCCALPKTMSLACGFIVILASGLMIYSLSGVL